MSEQLEHAVIVWLVETLHYPFDMSFSTPPPVDHGKLADYWNESDQWSVTAEEARSTVYEEAGICPCGRAWNGHPNPHAITCPMHAPAPTSAYRRAREESA